MNILLYCLLALTAVVNTAGQVFLKLGSEDLAFSGGLFDILKSSWKLLVGLFFFGLTFALSTVLNKRLDATFVYPTFTGLTFLLLSIVMVVLLKKEDMSVLKIVGMFIIIFGILLMSVSQKTAK